MSNELTAQMGQLDHERAINRLEKLLEAEFGSTLSEKSGDFQAARRLATTLLGSATAKPAITMNQNSQDSHYKDTDIHHNSVLNQAMAVAAAKNAANRDWDAKALDELVCTGAVCGTQELTCSLLTPGGGGRLMADAGDFANIGTAGGGCIMVYSASSGVRTVGTVAEAIAAVGRGSAAESSESSECFWVDIMDPTAEEMAALAREFDVHPLTVEDILTDSADRDKLERVAGRGYALLIYRALGTQDQAQDQDQDQGQGQDQGPQVAGFSVIIQDNCVLSFHDAHGSGHVRRTLGRLCGHWSAQASSPFYVAYALVDEITDALQAAMRAVEAEVQAVDALVMTTTEKPLMLRQIGSARRRLLGIWRVLLGKPDVVRALMRLRPGEDDYGHYLTDVLDHLAVLLSLCAQCEMVLSRAHANYMAQLSLELGEITVGAGVFSNQWMVLAGILLPLQFVAGLFGMNVTVPWMGHEDTPEVDTMWPWMGIFGGSMVFLVVSLAFMRYSGSL
ncbi:hypothetical protein BX661DRAFT_177883 [Kickxella alabastrina]|uniref:uncharacterized protein n=1 Tax=Kickxella alabastrina TaxID=61397 RepID=UPI00222005B4|nr:uncharacterized protein BX661DRAFT_177883 [Kickxella alabastrina]KAI7833961.1 hypothetical protein BX661DRAFT_177883 [Kickxella alabastrina]